MDTFKARMARVKRERKLEQDGAVGICRLFLWTGFSALIGTPLTILAAHALGMSRSEAVSTVVVWLLVPVMVFMFDFMIIIPLAEHFARRD